MFIVSGVKGTGKTRTLLEKAHYEGGAIACADPEAMRKRAYSYGIVGLDIIAYEDVAIFTAAYPDKAKALYIHDVNRFLETSFPWVKGYSMSFN